MLRPQSAILLISLLLGIILPGCGGRGASVHYDGRLAAADSLLRDEPDSALAIITALPTDSLATEHDRAYRYLLLTQARYRAYVTATSDSDINRAVAYFAACRPLDREKLTRAYIYKGAVMDELGHPDSAMLYYKHAEATAAPDDYFNLGYVNMRIASLYTDQVSQDSISIIKYKYAIHYFSAINDTDYLIPCFGDLGAVCGVKYPDSSEYYLSHAIYLAQKYDSTKQYTYKSKLAGLYYYSYHDYKRANELAMDVFRHGKDYSLDGQYFYYAAWTYLKMRLLDSAMFILKETPKPKDAVDSMNMLHLEAEIAHVKNDALNFSSNMLQSREKEIQIMTNSQHDNLKVTETDFHRIKAEHLQLDATHKNKNLVFILIAFCCLTLLLAWFIIHQKTAIKRNIEEKKDVERMLSTTVSELKKQQQRQQELNELQGAVSELFGTRIDALNELYNCIKFKTKAENNNRLRTIIPLSSVVMGMNEDYQPLDVKLPNSFWMKMKSSVDGEFNGIMSYIEKSYPNLAEKELQLFCLLCANVPPQIIKLCMNYTNVKSVSNRINVIIKKKMGLKMTLDELISQYMKGEL